MRLVKNHGMRDPLLDASAEHILIKAVKDQRCECLLQVVILRSVDPNYYRLITSPQALNGFGCIEDVVVGELLQSRQQRAQATVRFRLGAKNFHEAPKSRLRQIDQISIWIVPSSLYKTLFNPLADSLTLNVA